MIEFKRVLFPTDMSDASLKIVPFVKTMANRFDAEIHLLYVARSVDYLSALQLEAPTLFSFNTELLDKSTVSLAQFKEKHFGNKKNNKSAVVLGYPSEEILNYVSKEKIDLIIMGTHGRRGLEKVFFGSVAEQVVKSSPVPVLVINPHRIEQMPIDPSISGEGVS